MRIFILTQVIALVLFNSLESKSQDLYFPPISSDVWEQMSVGDAGYCDAGIETLDSLLESKNSKAFILLRDGKIVHEKYFGSFTIDSLRLWNSAGKSMTAALVGIAQQEGLLSLEDKTSTYLGQGWTSATIASEDLITIWHQLTMTSGLDDSAGDVNCTDPACLQFISDAGTRWAYHNGPYTLLGEVIEAASNLSLNAFFGTRIRNKIGMNGIYLPFGYNNVLGSNSRSMARFGLLMLNNGVWDGEIILSDSAFISQMTSSSQAINPSYGYLWWLNGKSRYRLPNTQQDFQGSIAPSAPSDAYAALGKDGQILSVIPSQSEVWIRMGNAPDGPNQLVASVLFEEISEALESARCTSSTSTQLSPKPIVNLLTNPVHNLLQLQDTESLIRVEIVDTKGHRVLSQKNITDNSIDVSSLPHGAYTILGWQANGQGEAKQFVKL